MKTNIKNTKLLDSKTLERFWRKVNKTPEECWEWTGSRRNRYGSFKYGDKSYPAHRFSYFLHTGYMPCQKEYVCHHCDNTYCVNPHHLFLGTQQDNMDDMVSKGRSPDNRGERNPRSRLNNVSVRKIRELYAGRNSVTEISFILDIPLSTISNILNGTTWNDGGFYEKPRIKPKNKKLTLVIEKEIRRLRYTQKLSQDKISEIVGISQSVVSRVLLNQAKGWSDE